MQRPATPKSEKPSVTIANLERENHNLARRINDLSQRILESDMDRNRWRSGAQEEAQRKIFLEQENREYQSSLEEAQAKVAKLESVLCGYRQAIMDVNGYQTDMVAK